MGTHLPEPPHCFQGPYCPELRLGNGSQELNQSTLILDVDTIITSLKVYSLSVTDDLLICFAMHEYASESLWQKLNYKVLILVGKGKKSIHLHELSKYLWCSLFL